MKIAQRFNAGSTNAEQTKSRQGRKNLGIKYQNSSATPGFQRIESTIDPALKRRAIVTGVELLFLVEFILDDQVFVQVDPLRAAGAGRELRLFGPSLWRSALQSL